MDFSELDDKIENELDYNLKNIIALIIDAVSDFPELDLTDTDEYFDRVKTLLGTNTINMQSIDDYITSKRNKSNEKEFWVIISLNSLYEAYILMDFYKIPFEKIKRYIDEDSTPTG
ncbi:MAG: hypothetical protein CVV25_11685 [Ignavibacteriae bacterium HGW-Ignavibacteriae-4]|jgi:hypothetical protein|nr:MAG: hypothetical protein CVV25_11685 [Ignavibacteriae bacterium HGW-Ignavibacteriae-4]